MENGRQRELDLNDELVWDWSNELFSGLLGFDYMTLSWLGGDSLQRGGDASSSVGLPLLFVTVDSGDEG